MPAWMCLSMVQVGEHTEIGERAVVEEEPLPDAAPHPSVRASRVSRRSATRSASSRPLCPQFHDGSTQGRRNAEPTMSKHNSAATIAMAGVACHRDDESEN